MMSESLTEEQMRQALFGSAQPPRASVTEQSAPSSTPARKVPRSKPLSSRLRVTMTVTKVFEGPEETFVHDANTLSSLVAEGEAKATAKKANFRYFEVVSIQPVQV
ncbi:hypothetical protein [Pseudomonas viridiflava]|uniref:hypothetical protein n=1 Tax=Pseudomonas viridiflava TaxID=33069 RepID=UPI000F03DCFC